MDPHQIPKALQVNGAARWCLYLIMILAAGFFVMPLVWMISIAAKPANQAMASNGIAPTFDVPAWSAAYFSAWWQQVASNFDQVWNSPLADFPTYLRNTLIVAFLSVCGMTLSSAIVAFGFSRVQWKGRDTVFLLVLLTLMVPQAVVMMPQYMLFKSLGLIGTLVPLWLPSWFAGGFSIFLLRQFFLTLPRELDESARMDGCSQWGIFWRIILPLSKPALIVVMLMQSVTVWNDFLGPLLFLNKEEQYTLSLGLQMYQSQHGGTPWNLVMMASCLVVVPVLVLYLWTRRYFHGGEIGSGSKDG